MHWSLDLLVSSGKEAVVFSAIGAAIALFATFVAATTIIPAYGFVLLLEATGLMIVGGALDMSSSAASRSFSKQLRLLFGRSAPNLSLPSGEERRRAQFTAAIHSVTGVMLLAEAAALAAILY